MSEVKNGWRYVFACLFLILISGMWVQAAEMDNTTIGTLQQLTEDAELKQAPDVDSDTLARMKAGEAVILESSDSQWSMVIYKGTEGYIVNAALGIYGAEESEELEQEFQAVEEENTRMAEEYELLEEDRHSTAVWGVIITLLVAAVFGVGIVTALKQNKEGEKR